jgi:hypothetical protein
MDLLLTDEENEASMRLVVFDIAKGQGHFVRLDGAPTTEH